MDRKTTSPKRKGKLYRGARSRFGDAVRDGYFVEHGFQNIQQIALAIGKSTGWVSKALNEPESATSQTIKTLVSRLSNPLLIERIGIEYMTAIRGDAASDLDADLEDPERANRMVLLATSKIMAGEPHVAQEMVSTLLRHPLPSALRRHLWEIAFYLFQRLGMDDKSLELSLELVRRGEEDNDVRLAAMGSIFRARAVRTSRGVDRDIVLRAHGNAKKYVRKIASMPVATTNGFTPDDVSIALERTACDLLQVQQGQGDVHTLRDDLDELEEISRTCTGAARSGSLLLRICLHISLENPFQAEELLDQYRLCDDPAHDVTVRAKLLEAHILTVRGAKLRAEECYRALEELCLELKHIQVGRIARLNLSLLHSQ
ncbi:MAG: hypothetical protein ACO1SV_07530 [Fimbriimonas sp.]